MIDFDKGYKVVRNGTVVAWYSNLYGAKQNAYPSDVIRPCDPNDKRRDYNRRS